MKTKLLFFLATLLAMGGNLSAQAPLTLESTANGLTQHWSAGGNVTRGQIVKLNSSGQVVPMATTDTTGALGVAVTSATLNGDLLVSVGGSPLVQVDGACTAGNAVLISTTSAGQGHCAATASGQTIGTAINGSTGAGFVNTQLSPLSSASAGGGISPNSPVPAICVKGVCYSTPANTQIDTSATFTSGLPTVTTSAGAPAFSCSGSFPCTPSPTVRAQASICNTSPNPEKCTAASADTTILSYTGAHTATLATNFTSNSTGTHSNQFSWGSPDDAAIASAVSAAVVLGRATIQLPCSGMWIEQAAFVFPVTTPGPMTVQGCGGGTDITIGYNFDYTNCSIGCFYDNHVRADFTSGVYWNGQDSVADVRLSGMGNPSIGTPPANKAWILLQQFQYNRNVSIRGANWNTTNGFAAIMLCGGAFYGGGIQAGGDWAFRSPSGVTNCANQGGLISTPYMNNGNRSAVKIEGNLATQAVTIASGTWIYNDSVSGCTASNDANPITLSGGVLVMESGVEISTGSAPCQQSVNSVSYIDGLYTGGGGNNGAIAIFHGKSYIKNVNFTQNTGLTVYTEAADAFAYDLGGWTLSSTPPQTLTGSIGNYYPFKSVSGACTGVATASQTLGLFGTGPNVTATTCTSTIIGSGVVMDRTGNLFTLQVTASAGGVNASSGVLTVLKNGIATTVTCTLGTGTSCADLTHIVPFSQGDLISIQFTTQGAETLAGVKAVVAAE